MNQVQVPRLEALQTVSDHYSADPYSLSLKARKRFREEKKVEREKQESDEKLKSTYGLPEVLSLSEESEESRADAREHWLKGREALRLQDDSKRRKLVRETDIVPISRSKVLTAPQALSARTTGRQGPSSASAVSSLRARILENTARHSNPLGTCARPKLLDRSSIFRKR